jgi:hypothetical protein
LSTHFGLVILGRANGDVVDRPAVGVAPIERALRSAQHLDAVGEQGVGLQDRRGVGAEIDAVDIDRDAGLHREIIGLAADSPDVRPVVVGRI